MKRTANMLICLALLVLLHYGCRIFVTDWFHIESESMLPTYSSGERIYVNKLLFGARIYTSTDFGAQGAPSCFRLPGIRKIRPGDVVVFNYPFGNGNWEKIEFRMNDVYCKRVLGTPGDTVSIINGMYCNNSHEGIIGVESKQDMVRMLGRDWFEERGIYYTIPTSFQTWTVLSMGPLLVPAKGIRVHLDNFTRGLYLNAIEYEGGNPYGTDYEFRQNWYFLVGDNAPDSEDSRFFGFVPEKFIVGIVPQRESDK